MAGRQFREALAGIFRIRINSCPDQVQITLLVLEGKFLMSRDTNGVNGYQKSIRIVPGKQIESTQKVQGKYLESTGKVSGKK